MNFFRKGTLAALVIGLILGVVGLSQANYNIRQNSDGTTDWVDPSVDRFGVGGNPEVRVGRQYFNVRLTSIADPFTYYFVSPVSGVLFSAFLVQNSNPIGLITSTITFGVMAHASPGRFIHPATGGSFLIPPTDGQLGQIWYNNSNALGLTFPNGRRPSDVTKMEGAHMDVRRGGIISIGVGGEGGVTGASSPGGVDLYGQYDVWIIIDPR